MNIKINKMKRKCFICEDDLSSKSKPTVYKVDKNYRLGAPKYLYLCAKCANKNAPTLESLIRQYEEELEQND